MCSMAPRDCTGNDEWLLPGSSETYLTMRCRRSATAPLLPCALPLSSGSRPVGTRAVLIQVAGNASFTVQTAVGTGSFREANRRDLDQLSRDRLGVFRQAIGDRNQGGRGCRPAPERVRPHAGSHSRRVEQPTSQSFATRHHPLRPALGCPRMRRDIATAWWIAWRSQRVLPIAS